MIKEMCVDQNSQVQSMICYCHVKTRAIYFDQDEICRVDEHLSKQLGSSRKFW